MTYENWLERAERLRRELARLESGAAGAMAGQRDAWERVTIARWLREEFSNEPPEDNATLLLFEDPPSRSPH